MRLPIEWIKEHVQVEATAEELADRLTMAGLEVEEKAESAIGPVLDIKVTPNRGDCLSVKGVAWELRAAYGVATEDDRRAPADETLGARDSELEVMTSVAIEAPDLCPRYAARIVRTLKIGPSPQWMQDRITAAGMRPINNIVDITNYVMLETGQPLHAFDFDRLGEGRIVVRRAAVGETLTTLDGQERALTPNMLVIADATKPVALAGVMGGGESEVSEQTKTMLLESAHFDPLAVRRTAKALDMRTEASYRFERFVDPAGVAGAANRACELIKELGAGEPVEGIVDVVASPIEARKLSLRIARVSEMLGYEVEPDEVEDTLTRLGFEVNQTFYTPLSSALELVVPSWRPDIVREIDLVEEVGRVLGYERIPEKLPTGKTLQGGDSPEWQFAEQLRSVLAGAGLQEVVSHSLMAESALEDGRTAAHRVGIRSALSAELSGLRRSLLPGLVDILERNARRAQAPLAFFEVGRVFHRENDSYREATSVAAVLAGPITSLSWQKEARTAAADFHSARGLVEAIAEALHIRGVSFTTSTDPRLHSGRSADVLLDGAVIGHVGELHPRLIEGLTTRHRLLVFELHVGPLMAAQKRGATFRALTPYPAVVRDVAPRVAMETTYRDLERSIESLQLPIVEKVALTDLFAGAPLPDGTKSLTLSLTFRATDRTLTDEEVNDALDRVRTGLERDCDAHFAG
jgi:phenylalanyl-tRNA synthetase beta chain